MAISLAAYNSRITTEMATSMGGRVLDLPRYYHEAMLGHLAHKRLTDKRWRDASTRNRLNREGGR